MTSLEGKVAWITGGGKGIGRAVALALAARGVRVLVTGRDEKALGRVVGEIANGAGKARHLVADVRDAKSAAAAVAKAVDTWGQLDIVVANAGLAGCVALGGDLAEADAILHTNLMGAFYTFNAAAPILKDGGRIVALSGALAKCGVAGYAAYSASKAGVLGLVRATAVELAPRKITCNAIVPAAVDTDPTGAREALNTVALAASPIARLVEPESIADVVLFLCTKAGDALTGQEIAI